MLENYRHLKYNNSEIRMLIGKDTNNNNIIFWHGLDSLKGPLLISADNQNTFQTYCNVEYTSSSIKYEFFIKDKNDNILSTTKQAITNLLNKVTINTTNEQYIINNTSDFNYTPNEPLALALDKDTTTPRIFSNSINLPTYSGCTFLTIPSKIYGETLVGQTGLHINGLLTQKESFSDICMASFSNNNALYSVCTAEKPAIIVYEPKYKYAVNINAAKNSEVIGTYKYTENGAEKEGNLYDADLNGIKNTNHNSATLIYNEAGTQLLNNTDLQWKIGIGCGFLIVGDDEEITCSKIQKQSIYHLTSNKYNIGPIDNQLAGGLFKVNNDGSLTIYTKATETKTAGTLPDGNVIALIQIGKNPDNFFKQGYRLKTNTNPVIGNNFWHFHVGGKSLALSTYQHAFPTQYSTTWNSTDGVKVEPWSDQSIVHTEEGNFLDFKPIEGEWYALYVDTNATYKTATDINCDLIKIRLATPSEKQKWLNTEETVIQTNGNVRVENNEIKCDFKITLEDTNQTESITLTLPEAASLNTDIKVFEEYYHNTKNENESFKYYPYNKKYILKIDSNNSSPEIFDSGNPIDKVYYSGCTFKVYNDIIKMPNYYSGINSLNIIGLTYTDSDINVQSKSLGQGVVAEGDGNNFVKYPSDNTALPIINWNPQSFYRWQTTEPSSGEYIVKSGSNGTKIYYIKDPNLSIKNGDLNSTYCQSQCFEFAGPNAEPTGYSGYHWGDDHKISAINTGRKLNTNILHGPDNGRFIGYFKFDSNLKQDLFTDKDPVTQKYIFKPETGYFIHWHAYINTDSDFVGESEGANVGVILLPKLRDDAYALCKHAYDKTLYNANTGILSKIYKYTKTGDTYNYSLTTPQVHKDADEVKPNTTGGVDFYFPELGKWYGLIIDPNYPSTTYKQISYKGRNKVIYLCEITNENGEVKEEHKPYLFSNQVERYCKKGVNSFLFSITINDTDIKTCSIPINDIETYFEVKKEDNIITEIISFKEEQKNNLINTYPEALFKPTNDLCLNIEKTANNKTIYNINNPICIPEMSGCRFVNIN